MNQKRLTVWDWLVMGTVVVIGSLFIYLHVFVKLYGVTKEPDLTLAQGVPTEVSIETIHGRYDSHIDELGFRVGGYHTEYSSDDPHYDDVLAAVQDGSGIKVWVSTKQETVFPRHDYVPIYKFGVGDKLIVSYQETIEKNRKGSDAMLIVGMALIACGVVPLLLRAKRARF